jgi:hypothetical protein
MTAWIGGLRKTTWWVGPDPNRPEDLLQVDADEDGVGGDDAADCLGYLVATQSREVVMRK